MSRIAMQFCINGEYGEIIAKSVVLTEQEMVDKIFHEAKTGISFRFLGDNGIIVPTGLNVTKEYILKGEEK